MNKKLIIPSLILILAVIGIAVDVYQSNLDKNSLNSPKTYSGDGISFKYPQSWSAYKPLEKGEVVSVGDSGQKILLTVYKNKSTENSTETVITNVKSNIGSDPLATNQTETNRTVNGLNATEITYLSIDDGSPFKESVLTFKKDNFTYVIQYHAFPPEAYNQNKKQFDLVISSFKVQ